MAGLFGRSPASRMVSKAWRRIYWTMVSVDTLVSTPPTARRVQCSRLMGEHHAGQAQTNTKVSSTFGQAVGMLR